MQSHTRINAFGVKKLSIDLSIQSIQLCLLLYVMCIIELVKLPRDDFFEVKEQTYFFKCTLRIKTSHFTIGKFSKYMRTYIDITFLWKIQESRYASVIRRIRYGLYHALHVRRNVCDCTISILQAEVPTSTNVPFQMKFIEYTILPFNSSMIAFIRHVCIFVSISNPC